MEQIKIRDLHIKTGEWVRRTTRGEGVIITERGRPVDSLIPFYEDSLGRSFREQKLTPEFDALSEVPGEVAGYISEDRYRSLMGERWSYAAYMNLLVPKRNHPYKSDVDGAVSFFLALIPNGNPGSNGDVNE